MYIMLVLPSIDECTPMMNRLQVITLMWSIWDHVRNIRGSDLGQKIGST